MVSKLVTIDNAIPSDSEQIGGEYTNQLSALLNGISVDADETIKINTIMRFYSGKFMIYDSDQSHLINFSTENIATGNPRTIMWRAMVNDVDYPVLELQQQTIQNKLLDTNVKFNKDFSANNFGINDLKFLSMRDQGSRNMSIISVLNTDPNAHFEFLFGYNTSNFAGISGGTDIEVNFGNTSEIDSFNFYSKATGTNVKLLSIIAGTGLNSKLDVNVSTVDFHDAVFLNFVVTRSEIPSAIVYDDEANTYGPFAQTFLNNTVKIRNPANTFGYTILAAAIAANYNLSLPLITSDDTLAVLTNSQVFLSSQKIVLK